MVQGPCAHLGYIDNSPSGYKTCRANTRRRTMLDLKKKIKIFKYIPRTPRSDICTIKASIRLAELCIEFSFLSKSSVQGRCGSTGAASKSNDLSSKDAGDVAEAGLNTVNCWPLRPAK
jgi:hypothetical protein